MQSSDSVVPANHHAHFPPFAGRQGLVAAIGFLSGRDDAARLAIELTGLQTGDRLVDIGCGPGIAVVAAHELGAHAVGVDPAPVMLRVGRVRWIAKRGIEWKVGSAEALPETTSTADVVWSLATVHHWDDLDAGLTEVTRVLKPSGRFLAMERLIEDPYAEGVASHGWTPAQAETFAGHCRDHGYVDVEVGQHAIQPAVLSVLARLP